MDAMQHLKEQLEQRTRMIEANIQRQQEELRQIQEELQRVQGQGLQVRASPNFCLNVRTMPQIDTLMFGYVDVPAARRRWSQPGLSTADPGIVRAARERSVHAGGGGAGGEPAKQPAIYTHRDTTHCHTASSAGTATATEPSQRSELHPKSGDRE